MDEELIMGQLSLSGRIERLEREIAKLQQQIHEHLTKLETLRVHRPSVADTTDRVQ